MRQVPWIGSTTGCGCARPFGGDPLECAGRGAIAQLGERLNGIQKVRGSNPLSSTNLLTARCGPSPEGPFDFPALSADDNVKGDDNLAQ